MRLILVLVIFPLVILCLPSLVINWIFPGPIVSWNNCWKVDKSQCDTSVGKIEDSKIHFEEAALIDLKERLKSRRSFKSNFKEEISESGVSNEYGITQKFREQVLTHWEQFDWRKAENKLNSWNPKEVKIEGLKVHFFHIQPKTNKKKTTPLLLLHGWPGSVWEFHKLVEKFVNPNETDFAFDVIIPSLIGYGFSDEAEVPGMDLCQQSIVFVKLMKKIYGSDEFICQGGDWGSFICQCMALIAPEKLTAIHLNLINFPAPLWSRFLLPFSQTDSPTDIFKLPYFFVHAVSPHTIGLTVRESPVSLGTWVTEKFYLWSDPESQLSLDDYVGNLMIYWLTDSITSSIRLYKESMFGVGRKNIFPAIIRQIHVKTGISLFPKEISNPPTNKWILKSKFSNLVHVKEHKVGGHFAALEQPQALYNDIQQFLKTLV